MNWHKPYIYLTPLLITWYVFIALYSHNISGITIDYFWRPFLLATLATAIFFVAIISLCRNLSRASLLASFLLITFFAYGHIATLIGGQDFDPHLGNLIFAVYALLLAGLIWYFKKGSPAIGQILKYLAVITVASIGIALVTVIPVEIGRYQANAKSVAVASNLPTHNPPRQTASKPDIYYLIFDRYAGVHTLKNYYNFDNQPFLNTLRDQGFYVTEDSYTNYPKTTFSLSSSLNIDYLQALIDEDDPSLSDATTIATLLSNNKVGQTLQKLGYTYYHLGNWYELTDTMAIADVNVQPDQSDFPRYDTFTDMILESTYYPLIQAYLPFTQSPQDSKIRHRLWSEFQHHQINQLIPNQSPKFVVMHMLLPHNPFVYDANCKPLNPPLDRWDASPQDYTNQLQCANQVITDITSHILQTAASSSIIIVQSDEGPEAKVNKMPHHWQFRDASTEDIKERSNILNAYYFPDQNYNQLYQSISPVNTFRTIFRQYFNLDTPNLEDKTYVFPDKDHLFEFKDVTQQLIAEWR